MALFSAQDVLDTLGGDSDALSDDVVLSPVQGGELSVSMQSPGDTDWFEVNLTAGTTYTVSETGLSSIALMALLSASQAHDTGNPVEAEPLNSATTAIDFTADTTGTYFLRVFDESGITGPYTLTADIVPNSYTLQTPGMLTVGSTFDADMQSVGDTDWFKVNLTAGTTYTFTETGLSADALVGVAPASEAQDVGGIPVGLVSLGGGATDTINFTADTTAAYFVEIFDEAAVSGPYTLTANIVPDSFTLQNPGMLTLGSTFDADMQSASDTDWFKVNLTAGTTYTFTENGLSDIAGLEVLPANEAKDFPNAVVNETSGSSSTVTLTFTADATAAYFLGVSDTTGLTGAYTVAANTVPDSFTLQTPGMLTVGSAFDADMQTTGDTNWFEVNLTAGTTYTFTETGLSEVAALDLLPANEAKDTGVDVGGAAFPSGATASLTFTADTTGAYFLSVIDESGATGAYTVTANTASDSYTLQTPGMLTVGSTFDADMQTPGATDWFKVNLTAGTTYSITETGLTAVTLMDILPANQAQDTGIQVESENVDSGAAVTITFTADATAAYLLEIFDETGFTGAYTLTANIVPDSYTLVDPGQLSVGSAVATAPADDFSGAGMSAVLFGQTNGTLATWEMDGTSITGGGQIGSPGGTWAVVGTGDFYDAGKADILFQDASQNLAIWEMNGTAIVGGGAIGNPGGTWSAVGVGDFYGNGHSDVLFQDASHNLAIWEMNGTSIVGGGAIGNPGGTWAEKAVGDFNGDGMSDILFQDASGNLAIWEMNGTSIVGGGAIGNPGAGWTVEGTGYFYANGMSDILFENSSGEYAIWEMNGTSIVGGGDIGNPGGSWQFAGVGDYTGNGHDDILFTDSAGDLAIWEMNGTSIVGGGEIGNPGAIWHVLG